MRKENGITLIALVITIVVILILAGVSLTLILGDNGVLKQAQNAITETRNAEEKEKIEMAVAAARVAGNGVLTTQNLNIELGKIFGDDKTVEETSTRGLPAEYQEVEYIESTGTQYIDTGVSYQQGTPQYKQIEINCAVISGSGTIWGVESIPGRNRLMLYTGTNWRFVSHQGNAGADYIDTKIAVSNNKINIRLIENNVYFDNARFETNRVSAMINYTSGNTIPIFAKHNNNGYTCFDGTLRVYSFTIKSGDGSSTIRDMVPCYRKLDNLIGLYDTEEGKFYTNQGTGFFFKGKDVAETLGWNYKLANNRKYIINNDGKVKQIITEEKSRSLPKEYQQVEYIESSGTQYIDTGYKFNGGIAELDIKFSMLEVNPDLWRAKFVAGSRITGNQTIYSFGIGVIHAANTTYLRATSGEQAIDNGVIIDTTPNIRKTEEVKLNLNENNKTLTLTNKNETSSLQYNKSAIINQNIVLFGCQEYLSSSVIYRCRIEDNDELVRNYIPCYAITTVTDVNGKQCPSGTKGLYDTVEGKFYTNQGTGDDFIAGPDV